MLFPQEKSFIWLNEKSDELDSFNSTWTETLLTEPWNVVQLLTALQPADRKAFS